jgi:hypothetical protein
MNGMVSLPAARRASSVIALAAAIAGCPAPADTMPLIHVSPAAAGRLAAILDAPLPGARVHLLRAGEELRGPNAIGRPGDYVLENDAVVFVIDRLGSSTGFAESGGNVVDAADATVRADELGQLFTYFGVFPRQAVYDSISTGTGQDGSAWVEARGRELYEAGLSVTTRYSLGLRDRALRIETRVANTGNAAVTLPGLGDAIQWGGAEKIAPGKTLGFKGDSHGAFVGGVGRFASYAMAGLDGELDATSGGTWTDTMIQRAVSIPPHGEARYARLLVVGARADSASVVADRLRAAGLPVGEVEVDLVSPPGGAGVEVPFDAWLSAKDMSGVELTIRPSGSPARLVAALPVGRWTLAYAGGGGRAGVDIATVEVGAARSTRATLGVTAPAGMHVRCVDAEGAPSPCKATFERVDGGPVPDLGPPHVAGPARHQATTASGDVEVALAPGAYRVTVSRGPEFALSQADVTLAPGGHGEVKLSLRRVVDTTGYLGCDFHQHTMLGADSPVATRDRVIANAAEGVEIAVASEHNTVADLEPLVRELGLARELVSISGDELTTDASVHAWGHANVWPLPFEPGEPRGGAPPVRDRSPAELFGQIRRQVTTSATAATAADFVVQINHPRSGKTGYFDLAGFDAATGEGTMPGYEAHFDAVEVWNGRNIEARSKVLGDYLVLLRTGHAVTPVADTDTHGIVGQEAGYPRTYVRVSDDGHLDGWDSQRSAELVHAVKSLRDVVLTNGPMLRVSAGGVPVGGTVHGSRVTVRVHVESAPWVDVDELRVVRASSPDRPEVKTLTLAPMASGAHGADVTFALDVHSADAFVVIASGKKPLAPVLGSTAGDAEITPWAMSGAIWVDAKAPGAPGAPRAPGASGASGGGR